MAIYFATHVPVWLVFGVVLLLGLQLVRDVRG
jgi:hypothetical protein